MRLGVVNADGSGFRFIEKPRTKSSGIWSVAWADDDSFFCQDMERLYRQGLDGKTKKDWLLSSLVAEGGMNGDSRLAVSADGKTLLMDIEMNEESDRKEWDGPLPALWTLDLATEKTKRLTPKTLYAWDGQWLGTDSILFVSQAAGQSEQSIYRMSRAGQGKDRKRLVKNARVPSAAK